MVRKIGWGILATGTIAHKFTTGLQHCADANIVAVGSRSQSAADAFGDEFNIPHRHASYEALVADPEVEAIYIGTPHSFHKENALLCIEHGKAVLCEKPFAINAAQAQEVVDAAREKNVFVMEAMWTRFIPLVREVVRMVEGGVIGDLRMVTGDFGFRTGFKPEHRLFDPALGGGGLLDVGVYAVSFASMLLGAPDRIASLAELGETGVDEQAAAILSYPGGQMALIHTGVRTRTPGEATIMGTDGFIRIERPFWAPTAMVLDKPVLDKPGQRSQRIEIPFTGNGYNYQAEEVMRCLRSGKTESELMPLDETVSILKSMDEMRAQWGLRYPME